MLGRILCVLAFPVLGSAGTIVQSGVLGASSVGHVRAFDMADATRELVDAQFELYYTWGGPWSADFVPGETIAYIYTTGSGRFEINWPNFDSLNFPVRITRVRNRFPIRVPGGWDARYLPAGRG